MKFLKYIFLCAVAWVLVPLCADAQDDVQVKPTVVYGQSRKLEIGGITVEGVKNYEDYVLIG